MIPQLRAVVERVVRHQRDHPVGQKSDTELLLAYIVTLHSRIEDLERRVTNPHSATPTPDRVPYFDQQRWVSWDAGVSHLRAQWIEENSIVGDEQ